jgi:two-component system response regulator AtoC
VLDEVGELSPGVQAKLLRALQDGEVQPLGSGRLERVDVRVIACTNRDLAAEAQSGRFRQDLYYRLAVMELVIPPLRQRREDIRSLAEEFARRYAERFGMDEVRLAPELLATLCAGDWPGNVRELENTVARTVVLSPGGEIPASALEPLVDRRSVDPVANPELDPEAGPPPEGAPSLKEQLEALERSLVARALAATRGNQSEAARRLGLSRGALIDRLKKYGLQGRG